MGNEIPQQLGQFLRAILLGGSLALVYDLARALSALGGQLWEAALDALVGFGAAAALFLLMMAEDGELRLFVLLGALGGAVLFFCLVSPVLRPVWTFWVHLLTLPLRFGYKILIKIGKIRKKVFSFLKKWFTIISAARVRKGREEQTDGTEVLTTEDAPHR